VFLLLTVVGSLAAFVCTEAVMRDIAVRSINTWRYDPYDFTITGAKAYEFRERIASINGVSLVETSFMFDVIIGAMQTQIAVQGSNNTLFPLEYAEGRPAQSPEEIVISYDTAMTNALTIGQRVELIERSNLDKPIAYTVCGIISTKQGLARVNFLTQSGAERIHTDLTEHSTLLILLHPSASQPSVYSAIQTISSGLTIKLYNESFDQGFSIAEALISVTKMLLLAVAFVSLYMLIYLGQQERAYELGVLRALGFSKRKVLTTLILEGALILAAGGIAAFIVLFVVAVNLNLGPWNALLRENLPSGGLLLSLGLLAVLWTAWRMASRPITGLIRDR